MIATQCVYIESMSKNKSEFTFSLNEKKFL